jgi:hypothetical protein
MAWTLAGTTLPSPALYRKPRRYRGARIIKANGQVAVDLISASAKHDFYLEWRMLSETNAGYVQTAYDTTALTSGGVTFVDVLGDSYTVVLDPQQADLQIEWVPYRSGDPRANVTISLREV